MSTNPLQIAKQRRNDRSELHIKQRRALALELIADTLEAIRLDLADVIARMPQNPRSVSQRM
ncbi:MAG: hypothetical protein WCC11_02665 [Gammaproteobacteria bacterium]